MKQSRFSYLRETAFIFYVLMDIQKLSTDLSLIRSKSPLIHNITNLVVMNNTANALLAIGASPVMAHAKEEVADMARIASALVLNMGTLSAEWVEAMLIAGQAAKEKGVPVIFDPVGVGATPYRSVVAKKIIDVCQPDIIRGNASEIIALHNDSMKTKGVDSTISSESAKLPAKELARETGAVVVVSGAIDHITNGVKSYLVKNGDPMMERVTGMGCTCTAVVAAFAAVNKDFSEAAKHAMTVMGVAGERAVAYSRGPGSLQMNFLDELYNLDKRKIRQIYKG